MGALVPEAAVGCADPVPHLAHLLQHLHHPLPGEHFPGNLYCPCFKCIFECHHSHTLCATSTFVMGRLECASEADIEVHASML